jgi:hypothetical protein
MADKPKKLLDQVHDKLRPKSYSYATERSYSLNRSPRVVRSPLDR